MKFLFERKEVYNWVSHIRESHIEMALISRKKFWAHISQNECSVFLHRMSSFFHSAVEYKSVVCFVQMDQLEYRTTLKKLVLGSLWSNQILLKLPKVYKKSTTSFWTVKKCPRKRISHRCFDHLKRGQVILCTNFLL